jgi:hypothetical protein
LRPNKLSLCLCEIVSRQILICSGTNYLLVCGQKTWGKSLRECLVFV